MTTTPTPERAKAPRKKRAEKGVRITERDILLLQRACRYGALTIPMLQHTVARREVLDMFGNLTGETVALHRSTIHEQVHRLVRAGALETSDGPSNVIRPRNLPALLVPTRGGYDLAGTELTYKRPALATLLHTLSVAQMGLRHEADDWEVVTDRQVRSDIQQWRSERERARRAKEPVPQVPQDADWIATETDNGSLRGGALSGARGPRTHAPDLIIKNAAGERNAVEVELTAKTVADLREVMKAFASTGKYRRVIYYCPTRSIAARVANAANERGTELAERVTVRKFTPLYGTGCFL
ncbi:hypothetical protein [Nocardioides euryhalodurans]|uniref:Uncharacterized protein n=1 Tax=Nocardioides euryhalodurans TaxID=2518370 RepID=A0A4P7GNG8_9ACTN|nr:hypothetical protein [Nocardioides euryhalodurans]QBR93758.1 hypothetical protein EXE57_16855 [Nocardioides euryhalodurans]